VLLGALAIVIGAFAWAATQMGRTNGGGTTAARTDTATGPAVTLASDGLPKVDSAAGAIDAGKGVDSAVTRAPVVSGVLTVEIARPKPLHVGDSATLRGTARWPDGTATPLRWSSSADSIARIDEKTGVVIGAAEGTVTITAQAGAASKQVALTVLPAPAGAVTAGGAATNSTGSYGASAQGAPDVAQLLSARVQEFVQAVGDRNLARVTALYGAESAEDKKNLASLTDKLRNPSSKLKLSPPQVGMPVIRDTEATIDFIARVTWTTPAGASREPTVAFRVYFGRAADGWRLAGVRMLNALE
jgi:hypothetical protein